MKRFYALLLCLALLCACCPALAEGAVLAAPAELPAEVRAFFSSSTFTGYTVGERASAGITHQGKSYFFAVAQKDGHNVLYGFEKNDGQYAYYLRTDNCLPQGRGQFELAWETGNHYMVNTDVPLLLDDSLWILFTREDYEEQADTALTFEISQNGQWCLRLVSYNYVWDEAVVTSGSIAYYSDGSLRGTAYGVVETNLRYFSLSAFPRTLKEARQKLTNPPAIPSGELTAQRIKFTGGQKFEVYSGPGTEYLRGANGKASVSTNDWIQVFGTENGYILIQYAISADHMRFGYIDQSALPRSASVSPLSLAFADASITASCTLTDDPLYSQSSLRALSSGQQVKWLSVMGNWVYVEATGSGQPVRGFVPASCVSKTAYRQTASASFRNGDFSAQAQVELLYGVTAEITVTVDGPAAWYDAGADLITGYQLYANNVPVNALSSATRDLTASAWRTVFTLSASIPADAEVIGLCPIHAQSGQKADEALILNIRQGEIK